MSAPATSRHLRLLHRTGLVEAMSVEEDARLRIFRLRPEPFVELHDWLAEVERFWAGQLEAFRTHTERTRGARRRAQTRRRRESISRRTFAYRRSCRPIPVTHSRSSRGKPRSGGGVIPGSAFRPRRQAPFDLRLAPVAAECSRSFPAARALRSARSSCGSLASVSVFEWQSPRFDPSARTEVEVTFARLNDGTEVTLEHRGWKPDRFTQAFRDLVGLWWGDLFTSYRLQLRKR